MDHDDGQWRLGAVMLLLAALFFVFALLAWIGLDWGWRACAIPVGAAIGYSSAYLIASRTASGRVWRPLLAVAGVVALAASVLFFAGVGTLEGSFLYGLALGFFMGTGTRWRTASG